MKGVIWSYNWEDGLEQLKEIEKGYEHIQIFPIKKSIGRFNAYIIFENNDFWKVVRGTTNDRGHRANVSYIDRRISQKIVDEVIKPCSIVCPFQAYHYYGPHPDREFLRGHRAELDLLYDDIDMLSQEQIGSILKPLMKEGD